MPSGKARADTVLVFSMMLLKRLVFIFCQILNRSRSAPYIRPPVIFTTSKRAPNVLYSVHFQIDDAAAQISMRLLAQ